MDKLLMQTDPPVHGEARVAVLSPTADAPIAEAPPLGSASLRMWFIVYLLWLGMLTLGAQWGFAAGRHGEAAGVAVWAICLGTFYISLANNFVPLPTMWMVMLLASDIVGLPGAAPVRIAYVAGITAVATAMANLNEYHLVRWVLGSRAAGRVKQTRLVQWAIRWFRVSPFGILTLASFVPIPIDAVRWIAIADGYSRVRFFWANFVGRWVRYAVLAGATVWLSAGIKTIIGVQAGILLVAAVPMAIQALRRTRGTSELEQEQV
jgi:membrane protein YqaA with SNARE-associated domain